MSTGSQVGLEHKAILNLATFLYLHPWNRITSLKQIYFSWLFGDEWQNNQTWCKGISSRMWGSNKILWASLIQLSCHMPAGAWFSNASSTILWDRHMLGFCLGICMSMLTGYLKQRTDSCLAFFFLSILVFFLIFLYCGIHFYSIDHSTYVISRAHSSLEYSLFSTNMPKHFQTFDFSDSALWVNSSVLLSLGLC